MTTQAVPTETTPTSRITLRTLSFVLILVGLVVTSYLSYLKATDTVSVCIEGTGAFNCELVLNSSYSRLAGIPIAYLGLLVYIILGVLLLFEKRVPFLQEYGIMLSFGLTLFAWLFSMYLVYLQFFVLQALCPWCLTHETTITIFFIVTIFRLRNALR